MKQNNKRQPRCQACASILAGEIVHHDMALNPEYCILEDGHEGPHKSSKLSWTNAPIERSARSDNTLREVVGHIVRCCGFSHDIIQWTDSGPKQYGAECSLCGRRIAEENPAALIAAFKKANAPAHLPRASEKS